MARVVVIGGGVSGLASAARLATKGHQVTLVEKSGQLGGQVTSYTRDGFIFELGPNKLTLPAVYRDLFLKTGTSLEDSVELVEIQDGTRYNWSDGSSVLIPSVGGMRAAKALGEALGGSNDQNWRSLVQRAGEMWRAVRPELLERQLDSRKDLKTVTASRERRKILTPRWSLRKVTRKLIKDQRVRQLVESYALAQGADPRKAPATLITEPYVEHTFGTWWITGGIHKLIGALEARCKERGVEIRTGAEVAEIVINEVRARGVELSDGTTIEADFVVSSNAALVDTSASGNSNTQLSNSVFTIMAAIKGETPDLTHENVYLSPDPDVELKQLERGELPTEPTIRIHAPHDQTMSPSGNQAWTIQITAPLHRAPDDNAAWLGIDWTEPEVAEQYAQLIFEQLEARGLNINERLLWFKTHTPADITAETGAPGGSAFGPAQNGWRDTWLKPTIATETAGLFRIGDSVQPGPGLYRVGMGAEIVAEKIGRAKRRGKKEKSEKVSTEKTTAEKN